MHRFILSENIKRFKALLEGDLPENERVFLHRLTSRMCGDLARAEAEVLGLQRYPTEFGKLPAQETAAVLDRLERCAGPAMLIDPREGLLIVGINDAHAMMTRRDRLKVAGQRLFDEFPEGLDLDGYGGVASLFQSLQQAAQSRLPHYLPIRRYDLTLPDGRVVTRLWQRVSIPIFNDGGQLTFIMHEAMDVTPDPLDDADLLAASDECQPPHHEVSLEGDGWPPSDNGQRVVLSPVKSGSLI